MATELDKLVVKIEADLSSLKKGMAQANKQVTNSSSKFKQSLRSIGNNFVNLGARVGKFGAILAVAFGAMAIKKVVDTGIQIENLQVKLKALFGDAKEGEKAFDKMLAFASKVPFTLKEIQQGSGALAIVSKDADEMAKLLEITGNVASVTGLSFADASLQMQRSLSAGIASADMFRDAGVRNMLGFKDGATVSIEETAKAFERVFSGDGRFANASREFAKTLTGTLSMLGDKVLKFQVAIADEFFEELKSAFGDLDLFLSTNERNIEEWGRSIGRTLASITEAVVENIEVISTVITAFVTGVAVASLLALIRKITPIGVAITAVTVLLIELLKVMKENEKEFASTGAFGVFDEESESYKKLHDKLLEDLEVRKKNHEEKMKMSKEWVKTLEEAHKSSLKRFADIIKAETPILDIFDDAGQRISDTFGEAIASGESFRQSMLDIFQSVIAQVISLIIQLTIVEPLLRSIRSAFTGDVFSGEPTGSMVYQGRAMGGVVNPNMPYMVGERGAEMFVPQSAGTIVPNNKLGGGITIEQNLNFATGVSQTVRAEIMNLLPAIQESTVGAVRDARLRGGTFAKDFGG